MCGVGRAAHSAVREAKLRGDGFPRCDWPPGRTGRIGTCYLAILIVRKKRGMANGVVHNGGGLRIRVLPTVAYLAYVYVASYFLLMEPCVPAFDMETKEWTYHSSCRLGPGDVYLPPGGFTMAVPTLCWANRVFEPIDWTRHQFVPSADPVVLLQQPAAHVIDRVTVFFFLLVPVWVPMVLFREPGLRSNLRPLLALLPAAWYTVFVLFEPYSATVVNFAIVVIGMIGAFAALAFSTRKWRQLVNVPLWLVLFVATSRAVSIIWERYRFG